MLTKCTKLMRNTCSRGWVGNHCEAIPIVAEVLCFRVAGSAAARQNLIPRMEGWCFIDHLIMTNRPCSTMPLVPFSNCGHE